MTYSRSNEDDVIRALVDRIGEGNRVCVDIGAKDVEFSNVARLIVEDGWRGVLIERGIKNYQRLYSKTFAWSVCLINAVVTPENVNDLLPSEFQVLSIDIDGQDYHVWKALQATPPIVVIEYNPRKSGVDIQPRDDRYEWKRDKNYEQYGASRQALEKLAIRKGYKLADANTDNLFFTKE